MEREQLMSMTAEKAATELSKESIELIFRPSNLLELLLRTDFEGTCKRINEWWSYDSPSAMPYRFRN